MSQDSIKNSPTVFPYPHFCLLKHRAILVLEPESGNVEEVIEFLQSVVSNDMKLLKSEGSVYALMLTPQGKILYDFFFSYCSFGVYTKGSNLEKIQRNKDKNDSVLGNDSSQNIQNDHDHDSDVHFCMKECIVADVPLKYLSEIISQLNLYRLRRKIKIRVAENLKVLANFGLNEQEDFEKSDGGEESEIKKAENGYHMQEGGESKLMEGFAYGGGNLSTKVLHLQPKVESSNESVDAYERVLCKFIDASDVFNEFSASCGGVKMCESSLLFNKSPSILNNHILRLFPQKLNIVLLYKDFRHSHMGYRLIVCDLDREENVQGSGVDTFIDQYESYCILRERLQIQEVALDFEPGSKFPLKAGFEKLNAISYSKGCYVGQEVTVRMWHRQRKKEQGE